MESLQSPVPIWKTFMQLLGGPKKLAFVMGLFIAGVYVVFEVMCRISAIDKPRNATMEEISIRVAGYLTYMLVALQPFLIFLGGCNAVHRACLRDFETKMIESHRLSPVSNITMILGYIFGPTMQVLAISLLGAMAGGIFLKYTSVEVGGWFKGYAALLSTGIMAWAFTAFLGLKQTKPTNPAPIIIGFGFATMVVLLIPGISLVTGILPTVAGIVGMVGRGDLGPQVMAALVAINILYTLFWIHLAATRYRRPDLPAFNGWRGLAFISFWLVTGVLGLRVLGELDVPIRDVIIANTREQWLATLIGALLLSSFCVMSSNAMYFAAQRGIEDRGPSDQMTPPTVVVLASLLICAIGAGLGRPTWLELLALGGRDDAWMYTLACWAITFFTCAITLALVFGLYSMLGRLNYGAGITVLIMIFFCMAPVVTDQLVSELMIQGRSVPEPSWLPGISPVGTLRMIWRGDLHGTWPGLIVQTALTAVVLLISGKFERRLLANRVAEAAA